jgi:hypothetical protein
MRRPRNQHKPVEQVRNRARAQPRVPSAYLNLVLRRPLPRHRRAKNRAVRRQRQLLAARALPLLRLRARWQAQVRRQQCRRRLSASQRVHRCRVKPRVRNLPRVSRSRHAARALLLRRRVLLTVQGLPLASAKQWLMLRKAPGLAAPTLSVRRSPGRITALALAWQLLPRPHRLRQAPLRRLRVNLVPGVSRPSQLGQSSAKIWPVGSVVDRSTADLDVVPRSRSSSAWA